MNKKNNPRTHKVIARTSEDDYIRLTIIAKRYGFKSVYGLLVYVVHCFLRTADRTYYNTPRDMEKKLRRMFPIDEDAEKRAARLCCEWFVMGKKSRVISRLFVEV
jgi:hypothetical protein